MRGPQVENAQVRKALIDWMVRNEKTYSDVCRMLGKGWEGPPDENHPSGRPEVSRLKRTLGIQIRTGEKRSKTMNVSTAEKLVELMEMAPVDFGF